MDYIQINAILCSPKLAIIKFIYSEENPKNFIIIYIIIFETKDYFLYNIIAVVILLIISYY